jgi:hypothetical protein
MRPDDPHYAKLRAGYRRLVRILPTQGPNEELCFETSIRHTSGSYSAISYSWGDPTPSHSIIVDGHERLIAKNLWQFLQQTNTKHTNLRHTTSQQHFYQHWLWIDALSIDQSDARERTHQVGIMSEIFRGANQVISWLGPAYDNSDHVMTTIAAYTSAEQLSNHPTLTQVELSEAICSLCERPYWKRLWVFQEMRPAWKLYLRCGEITMTWDEFTLLWRVIMDIEMTDEDRSTRLYQSLATRMMTLRSNPIDSSLWNLLKETRDLECADQRDRVYALLGVATSGHEDIEADYDTKVTPLRLAHMTLQNKYAIRPPTALNTILMDCNLIEDVFRMHRGTMLRYRRRNASGRFDSEARTIWYWLDSMYLLLQNE